MAGVRKRPNKGGNYQGYFIDASGKQQFFTGTSSRPETLRIARKLEEDHRQVRLGYRETNSPASKHATRSIEEIIAEYLAWGASQGGRRGKPWARYHGERKCTHLNWWVKTLDLASLSDLDGILPRVEAAMRSLQQKGRTGKTVANYSEALTSFCKWCLDRDYLEADPLRKLGSVDVTPQTTRRALTEEEIHQLLTACAPQRRLLYETALLSGLRAKELRHLAVEDLDVARGGLLLRSAWTKNRKDGFQPLSQELVKRLKEYADSREAGFRYEVHYRRRDAVLKAPENPLLYVPSSLYRDFDKDLMAAGIPKQTAEGKLDFHALRVTFVSRVIEMKASVKEAQELARHSTPQLTMTAYARAQDSRLRDVVDRLGMSIYADDGSKKYATCMQRPVGGDDQTKKNPSGMRGLDEIKNGGAEDLSNCRSIFSRLSMCLKIPSYSRSRCC